MSTRKIPDPSALKPAALNLRRPPPRKPKPEGDAPKPKKEPKPRPSSGRGPGRPPSPKAPRNAQQQGLAEILETLEAERDTVAQAYRTDPTVAAELLLLRSEMGVASAWGAYLRAQGNLTQAIKYQELAAKFSGRISALRELLATDQLAALTDRAKREDALNKGKSPQL